MLPTRAKPAIPIEPDSSAGPRPATTGARRVPLPRARVLKFGGSSVAIPDRIRDVARIVLNSMDGGPAVVVVSAFQGVTNDLLASARLAERRDSSSEQLFGTIAARHRSAAKDLLGLPEHSAFSEIDEQLSELRDALHGIRLLGHCPPGALDVVGSFGERLSAIIVAAHLNRFRAARFVDARQFVLTDEQFTRANVIFEKTNRATRQYFSNFWKEAAQAIPVVTGFIGATLDGRTTTIGRNGSDYTAAIVGAAIGASAIEIWTDVDGVLSADPKAVSSAFVLPQITYEQAMEMSYFGAKVLHPATIAPAVSRSIPILIRNTLNPGAPGTTIRRKLTNGHRFATGVTSMGSLTLFTLRGLNMVGVPGTAERLFRALAAHGVNVLLTSQASAEHTVCFAVTNAEAPSAVQAVTHEFRYELQHGLTALDQKRDQAIVALIGSGMKGRPDIASKVFSALGRHNIEIRAIAQGPAERNISCVIDAPQQARALNVIHQGFFGTRKPLALAVVGVGNIGSVLLRQLSERRSYLLDQGFDVKVVAVANSKRYVVRPQGIDLDRWREELDASPRAMDPRMLAGELAALDATNAAIVDCTADARIVDAYPQFVKANLHIITPNKRANVLPWRRYAAFRKLLAKRQRHFLYETNVGAGLPIISTLRDLIASGDEISKVEGIFSGTLSYLFNTFDGTVPFSELVREAHRKGYTEPDPREDLAGQDVARKLLVLARQTGLKLDLQDVRVESLVPAALASGPFSPRFYPAFASFDQELTQRFEAARSRGRVLRYVGMLENGVARAELQEVPLDHPLAKTKGSDNVIAFTTKRYADTPMVVQGPGAGAEVTAMGVFSDIFKLLHYLPQ